MGTAILPRLLRDCNDLSTDFDESARVDLVDFDSPHWGTFLVLSRCLREEMGGYPSLQEQSIKNALWRLIEQHGITQRMAMDFARERRAQRRKRALDAFWQKYTGH